METMDSWIVCLNANDKQLCVSLSGGSSSTGFGPRGPSSFEGGKVSGGLRTCRHALGIPYKSSTLQCSEGAVLCCLSSVWLWERSYITCLEKIPACLCRCRSIVCASRLCNFGFYKHGVKQSHSTATETMTSMLPDAPRRSQAILGQPQSERYHAAADVSSADRSGEDLSLKALQLRRSSVSSLFWEDMIPHQCSHQNEYRYSQLHTLIMNHNARFHMTSASQAYLIIRIIYVFLCYLVESASTFPLLSHSTPTFPKLVKPRWQRMDGP